MQSQAGVPTNLNNIDIDALVRRLFVARFLAATFALVSDQTWASGVLPIAEDVTAVFALESIKGIRPAEISRAR